MVATYSISVQSLGGNFDDVRAKASALAAKHSCEFWWKPEPNDWHRFVFTNHNVAILFVAFLRTDIIGEEVSRIKYGLVSPAEVTRFAEHCAYMRSTFVFARRLFSESTLEERAALEVAAPKFFANLDQVYAEFVIAAAHRITDPWKDKWENENFVVELFTKAFEKIEPLHDQLLDLQTRMQTHRSRIEKARHKLGAHADRETIKADKPLAAASWPEWVQFWKDLASFVSLVHEHVFGAPFDIEAINAQGEVELIPKSPKRECRRVVAVCCRWRGSRGARHARQGFRCVRRRAFGEVFA